MKRFTIALVALPVVVIAALIGIGVYAEHQQEPVHAVPEPKAGKLAGLIADLRANPKIESVRMVNPRDGVLQELQINDGDAFAYITPRGVIVGGNRWDDDLVDAVYKAVVKRKFTTISVSKAEERRLAMARYKN